MDPILDPPVLNLNTKEERLNRLIDKVDNFERHLGAYPGAYDPLNGTVYIIWERKAMIWLGRISESISLHQEMDIIPVELGQKLKNRVLGIINQIQAKIIMGNRY